MVSATEKSARQMDLFSVEAGSARRIWPVRELVERSREILERSFADVWVEGEISNLRPAPSGHLYFTLKDAEAQLPVVLFRRQALLLRFRPSDGLHVLVRGRASVYEQRGQLQLVAETMEPVGAGSLQLAFEQLKEKLREEGLFDTERKRPLPAFPRAVGIVTSPTGAVIRDFLNVAGRRHAALQVFLYPVTVQGETAAAEMEEAIVDLNASGLVDLIVLARGGGSLEDLAPFNSERLARAIAASELPVVSAVGHETDFTIADFVADLRAPTPSAAAELITEAQHGVSERVEEQTQRLERAARYQWLLARKKLDQVAVDRMEGRLVTLFRRFNQQTDEIGFRLERAMSRMLTTKQGSVAALEASVMQGDPRQRLARMRERLMRQSAELDQAMERTLRKETAWRQELDAKLRALSPLSVLERGYALVQTVDGALIRRAEQLAVGDQVRTQLSEGSFTSRVESVLGDTTKQKTRTRKKDQKKREHEHNG